MFAWQSTNIYSKYSIAELLALLLNLVMFCWTQACPDLQIKYKCGNICPTITIQKKNQTMKMCSLKFGSEIEICSKD